MTEDLIKKMKPMEAYKLGEKQGKKHSEPSEGTMGMISDIKTSLSIIHSHFITDQAKGIDGIVPRIERQTINHTGRLSKLEMKYWIASGAIIVLGWVSGFAVISVKDLVKQVQTDHDKITEIDSRY